MFAMADACMLCGEKIGRFDKAEPFDEGHPQLRICIECVRHKQTLEAIDPSKGPDAEYEYGIAKRYFIKILGNGGVSEEAEEALTKLTGVSADELQEQEQLKARDAELDRRVREELRNVMETNGFEFRGYDIVEYHGVVCGDGVQGTGVGTDIKASLSDAFGISSNSVRSKVKDARRAAREEMLVASVRAGGNAVVCVDYQPYVLAGNMLGVMAVGTAVTVRKSS